MTKGHTWTFMGFPVAEAGPQAIEWAKRYGRRIEGKDGNMTVVAYQWGNHIYITDEIVPKR